MNMFELNANSPKKPSVTEAHADGLTGQGIRRRAWPFAAAQKTVQKTAPDPARHHQEAPVGGATWSCSGKKADSKAASSDFVS